MTPHKFSSGAPSTPVAVVSADVPLSVKEAAAFISSPGADARSTISSAPVSSFRNVKYANTSLILAASGIHVSSIITAFIEGFVMRSTYEEKIARASKNARTIVQGDARLCSPIFGRVCKAIWPFKTAEELAALVGCSVRAAAYEISGEREPSAQSVLVVMDAMIPKRQRA